MRLEVFLFIRKLEGPARSFPALIIRRKGKIGPPVDLHKILDRIGISYVSIGSVCSEITSYQVKRFSFIVIGIFLQCMCEPL